MPLAHLTPDAGPEEVAAAIGSDGAVIVDAVAPEALLERIETELRPLLRRHSDRPRRLQR